MRRGLHGPSPAQGLPGTGHQGRSSWTRWARLLSFQAKLPPCSNQDHHAGPRYRKITRFSHPGATNRNLEERDAAGGSQRSPLSPESLHHRPPSLRTARKTSPHCRFLLKQLSKSYAVPSRDFRRALLSLMEYD